MSLRPSWPRTGSTVPSVRACCRPNLLWWPHIHIRITLEEKKRNTVDRYLEPRSPFFLRVWHRRVYPSRTLEKAFQADQKAVPGRPASLFCWRLDHLSLLPLKCTVCLLPSVFRCSLFPMRRARTPHAAGVPFTSLSQILPFILIGIGVDDIVSASAALPSRRAKHCTLKGANSMLSVHFGSRYFNVVVPDLLLIFLVR